MTSSSTTIAPVSEDSLETESQVLHSPREYETENEIINIKFQIEIFKSYYKNNVEIEPDWWDQRARAVLTNTQRLEMIWKENSNFQSDLSSELTDFILRTEGNGETGISKAELISIETWETVDDSVFEGIETYFLEQVKRLYGIYLHVWTVCEENGFYVKSDLQSLNTQKMRRVLKEKLQSEKLVANPAAMNYFDEFIYDCS
jgi:hypothetical protein